MVYSAYLALHYFRKTEGGKGKLVFTSSMAGLYPAGLIPLYCAAKHGVGWKLRSYENDVLTVEKDCWVDEGIEHETRTPGRAYHSQLYLSG